MILASRIRTLLAVGLLAAGIGAWLVVQPAERALLQARQASPGGGEILTLPLDLGAGPRGAEQFLAEASVLSLASLGGGRVLVGTEGGAFLLDLPTGSRQALPAPGRVPSRSVRAVLGHGSEPLLGLEDGGLARLGVDRRLQRPPGLHGTRVRALAEAQGRLWVGTARGGFWWVGPEGGGRWHPRDRGFRPSSVPCLAGQGEELLVASGTGALRWFGPDRVRVAELEEGAPLAVALGSQRAWVATEVGVYLWPSGGEPELVDASLSGLALAARGDRAWVGAAGGQLVELRVGEGGLVARRELTRAEEPIRAVLPIGGPAGDRFLFGGRFGLRSWQEGQGTEDLVRPRGLLSGFASALALDPSGSLWVGTFEHGLTRLARDGSREEHLLDDDLWQVNRLQAPDAERDHWPGLLVATSRGVFHRASSGRFEAVDLGEEDRGSPRIQSLLVTDAGLGVVGKDGLRLISPSGRVQLLSAFHGLPSNKAYCLAARGSEIFVGTLGGLARIESGRLRRTWRPASSSLPAGWIQALALGADSLWIGTFGGGLARLDAEVPDPIPLGEGPGEVNPNAMVFHRGRLYVGSAGEGLFVYDGEGRLLRNLRAGLPSWDVQSLTAGDGALLVGCTNGVVRIPLQEIEEAIP